MWGDLLDRLGWVRIGMASAVGLGLSLNILALTALGILPYVASLDLGVLVLLFFCAGALYLLPDIVINRYLPDGDRGSAHVRAASLYPAISLMATSGAVLVAERLLMEQGLGIVLALTSAVAFLVAPVLLLARNALEKIENPIGEGVTSPACDPTSPPSTPPGKSRLSGAVSRGIREWLSGMAFLIRQRSMRFLLLYNCALAVAIAPQNVFITPVLKTAFAFSDSAVAIGQFAIALAEIATAYALPIFIATHSVRALAVVAVTTLTLGNGLGGLAILARNLAIGGVWSLVSVYVLAHMVVLIGFTCSLAWIRLIRGRQTPFSLLGRTTGTMSAMSHFCGIGFSACVTVFGTVIAPHQFYYACAVVVGLIGSFAIVVSTQNIVRT